MKSELIRTYFLKFSHFCQQVTQICNQMSMVDCYGIARPCVIEVSSILSDQSYKFNHSKHNCIIVADQKIGFFTTPRVNNYFPLKLLLEVWTSMRPMTSQSLFSIFHLPKSILSSQTLVSKSHGVVFTETFFAPRQST